MTQTVNVFLLLMGAVQASLLSLWVFKQSRRSLPAVYLAMLLVVIALQLTLKAVTKIWLIEHVRIFYLISYKIPYVVGPLIYLYSKSLQRNNFKPLDVLHFFPFIILSYLVVLFNGLFINVTLEGILQALSLTGYAGFALYGSPKPRRIFIISVSVAEYIVIATLVLSFTLMDTFPDVRLAFAVLTILVYWITYRTLSGAFSNEVKDAGVVKYANSTLRANDADRIQASLEQMMVASNIYRDPELTIDLLAERLGVSRHHLSQVLNERIGKTYTEYVNDLRLEEVALRLRNPSDNRFTIAAIALDCGFNSMSTFNALFKKRTGKTPSKFRASSIG